jgi:hypothetical protein
MMVNPLLDGFPVTSDNKSLFSGGLTGKELGKRLGVTSPTITRAWQPDGQPPRPQYFAEWSRLPKQKGTKGDKKADPDNLAWVRRGDRYYPLT